MRDKLSEILTWMTFSIAGLVLGGATLEIMVYLPNWFHNMPDSLVKTRAFVAVRNPGDFFQFFVPLLLIVSILAAIVSWHRSKVRWALIIGTLILLGSELLTFFVVYPNIRIVLAEDVLTRPIAEIEAAANSFYLWGVWVRGPLMVLVTFGFYLFAARGTTRLASASSKE